MRRELSLATILILSGLTGCAAPAQTSGQLLDRLNSAELITADGPREQSLADVARDAATNNQAGLCLRAVDQIKMQVPLHDRTAEQCAGTFDGLGDRATADLLVGRISAAATRDRLRTAYAASPAPTRTLPH